LVQGTLDGTTLVPGNSSKDLNPLGYFLRKDNTTDPTTGGNVGNIAGATESWWRHNTAVADSASTDTGNAFAINVTTYAGMKAALRRMYNFCSRGSGGSPNLIVADQVTYETYENALDTQVRFSNTALGELGFDTIKLRGADVIWDEVVPDVDNGTVAITAGSAFFINTDFYNLIIDSERVSLRGRSNNLATVLEFAKSLESSSFFDSVRLKNATRRSLSEGEVTLFQIERFSVCSR